MIIAPRAIINVWRNAANDAFAASEPPADDVVAALASAPKALTDHVRYLRGTLTHLSGILLGTVAQASPSDRQAIDAGLAQLALTVFAAGDDGCEGSRA